MSYVMGEYSKPNGTVNPQIHTQGTYLNIRRRWGVEGGGEGHLLEGRLMWEGEGALIFNLSQIVT